MTRYLATCPTCGAKVFCDKLYDEPTWACTNFRFRAHGACPQYPCFILHSLPGGVIEYESPPPTPDEPPPIEGAPS